MWFKNRYETDGIVAKIYIVHNGEIYTCLVDAIDLQRVLYRGNWSIVQINQQLLYAQTGRGTREYMHRFLLGLTPSDKKEVDHKNGNGLDNRRYENIFIRTHAENLQNRPNLHVKNISGCNGVTFSKSNKKWLARVMRNGEYIKLGYYSTKDEAIKVMQGWEKGKEVGG